ncbi:ribosomal protein S18-alanine N-acetyltransferase [[Eubacterium] hominis]|uniref:ribosomal protein S18-alanine N-acetyltransferase n=1 Tax=[Eubacterium] hominis TaxID=2764325 RepID=UPI003A4DA1D3
MLRAMKKEDLNQILSIDAECFPMPWNEKQYLYELEENDYALLYVLEQDGIILGYIDFWITFDVCQLAKIAVLPPYRGKRYARLMMDQMIQDAQEKGCETISLEVRVSNQSAQKLYAAYDFINVNTRKRYYQDNGEDAYVLVKALGGNCE